MAQETQEAFKNMEHLTRFYMYKRISEYSKEPMKGKILGISGIRNFYPFINMKDAELTELDYPEINMQNLPYKNDSFDFVISDQVIEHLKDPKKAILESYRVLKRGGIAVHTTCFMNYIHPCPEDFWRFSPDALKYLCTDFSEIIQCEGWGNRIAIILCLVSNRSRFLNIPESKISMRRKIATWNEKKYPIVTWIIARK